jgi:hypothetical protein
MRQKTRCSMTLIASIFSLSASIQSTLRATGCAEAMARVGLDQSAKSVVSEREGGGNL